MTYTEVNKIHEGIAIPNPILYGAITIPLTTISGNDNIICMTWNPPASSCIDNSIMYIHRKKNVKYSRNSDISI